MGKAKHKRFNPSWKGSDKWIEDTRTELLSRPVPGEEAVLDRLVRDGMEVERATCIGRRYFVHMTVPRLRIAIHLERKDGWESDPNQRERESHRRSTIREEGWTLLTFPPDIDPTHVLRTVLETSP